MPLKPQDLYVCLKLALVRDARTPSFAVLADELVMSPSQVHAAVGRATAARLLDADRRPVTPALLEFTLHGARYAFYAERGEVTRGMPTAHAAPPLDTAIAGDALPPVWPDPNGTARGETLVPLNRGAPAAARRDGQLYQLLALVDVMRVGRARERKLAEQHLRDRLR